MLFIYLILSCLISCRAGKAVPTLKPAAFPTLKPTPTPSPTVIPTISPTTFTPTADPSEIPISSPSSIPITEPTTLPTVAPTVAPTVEPTIIPLRNCLFRGTSLAINDSLTSNNGLYNLTLNQRGNICIFDSINKRWCSGYWFPSTTASKMVITSNGKFGVIKTNNNIIWSPNYPIGRAISNIDYIIISNNGNFIVYNNTGIAWSCNRGTFSRYKNSTCSITSETESVDDYCNYSPTTNPTFG